MRTNWFIVIHSNGEWWVDNEGHNFGPFPSRGVAALEAVNYARRLGDQSRRALVYWPNDEGKMTLVRELNGDVEPVSDLLHDAPTPMSGAA